MPSYIELDKQALFPSSSNAGKVIFGVDNSGQATITDSAGQTIPVGGGGSINTGSFATTGSNTFTGNQTISGSIDFGGGSQIQSVSQSSGDGYGYTTLELNPDVNLGSDQYIVLDPTSPNHIHIRAGGIIDSSSAYLYLGGEKSNVVVRNLDNSFNEKYWVEINSQTGSTQNTWIFDEDGKLSMPGALEHGTSVVATGSYSHAEGDSTQAIGDYSHAEGFNTISSGSYSHAEGLNNTAFSIGSHAEGLYTQAQNDFAHSEGNYTIASGLQSHAEGDTTVSSGPRSHAEGYQTNSSGSYSHAEGYLTIALGGASHAEGQETISSGDYSHAEGLASQAIGDYSHAEGYQTRAIGDYSHAEGAGSQAIGQYSHAEGDSADAIGNSSHAEGVSTQAIGDYSHAEGDDTKTGTQNAYYAESVVNGIVTLSGSYGDVSTNFIQNSRLYLYDQPFDDYYTRDIFKISQSYFDSNNTIVELYDTNVNTTTAYVGDLGQGVNNWTGNQTIPGSYSHAEGNITQAIGNYSHAEGYQAQAIGRYSHAEGDSTNAIGNSSHAEGYFTVASGYYSHAEGSNTQAIGDYSHTEGYETKTGVQTAYSASISNGIVTLPSSYGDVAGDFVADNILYLYDEEFDKAYSWGTWAISQSYFDSTNTIVELYDTSVTTTTAYVGDINFGISNWTGDQTIPGNYAHSEGYQNLAVGDFSHAEGQFTQAVGYISHTEGIYTIAIGEFSHAEGEGTTASGYGSHAEGNGTQAIGDYSHAEGYQAQAIGDYSHAEGEGAIASASYQHVQGKYNVTSSIEGAFIVGNGTEDENRSNLIHAGDSTVEISGSVNISGSLTVNGSDLRPYKVYTALLTQNGDGTSTQTTGPLVVGKTYEIVTFETGDDFTNVANVVSGVINTNGCVFIATGTTPTDYSNGSELRDTSAPVAIILENTLGGDVVWTRIGVGDFRGTLVSAFTLNKTIAFPEADIQQTPNMSVLTFGTIDENTVVIQSLNNLIIGDEFAGWIEIRVYN